MAKIEKPATTSINPPAKRKADTTTPATTSKPSPSQIKLIQFKVAASLHQEIKMYAVEQGKTMTQLFMDMYKEYRSKHG